MNQEMDCIENREDCEQHMRIVKLNYSIQVVSIFKDLALFRYSPPSSKGSNCFSAALLIRLTRPMTGIRDKPRGTRPRSLRLTISINKYD